MTTSNSLTLAWLGLYALIYMLFLIPDKKGKRYLILGKNAIVLNSLAGWYMAGDYAGFIATCLSIVYFFNFK